MESWKGKDTEEVLSNAVSNNNGQWVRMYVKMKRNVGSSGEILISFNYIQHTLAPVEISIWIV